MAQDKAWWKQGSTEIQPTPAATSNAQPSGEWWKQGATLVEPEPPSLARSVGDSAIALGTGVAQGVKMVSDAFGADNAVSRLMGKGIQAAEGLESDYRKAEKQERARKIKTAEDSGSTWEEVKAYAGSFADAPLDTTLNAVGSVVPTLAAAALTGGGSAAAQLAARAAPMAIGAVQGAGAVKGGIYEAVEQRHLEAGATPEQAAARASAAQAYDGDNLGSIATGAGLGVLAGSTGAEAAVRRLASVGAAKQVADASAVGIAKGAAVGAAKEAPMEAVQGGQERLAANLAEQSEGFDTPTMRGVLGQAALEGMAAAPLGGGLGAVEASGRAGRADHAAARQNAEAAAQDAQAKTDAKLAADAMVADAQLQAQERDRVLAEQEVGTPDVPQTTPPDGAAALRAQQEAAAAARQQELEASRAAQEPDDEILQSTGQAEPVRPSEAMGLRADAGGLESVAAMAVDSGLTQQLQAEATAQQSAAEQKQEQSAQDHQGINTETGEVSDAAREEQIRERLDFLGQQGRAQGWSAEAVAQRDALQHELDLLSPGQRIEQLNAQADAAAAEAADWVGRQYKPNPKELPEHAAQGGPADVGEANEQRRLKKLVKAKGKEASARAQADALQEQGNTAAQLAAKHDMVALRRKKTDELSSEELQTLAADLGPRHVRAKRLQKVIAQRKAQAQPAINQGVNDRGPQTDQAQQASAQQPPAGAAAGQAVHSVPAADAAQAAGPAANQGAVNGGATAGKNGAQASQQTAAQDQAAIAAIAQEGNARREAERTRKLEASERWTLMNEDARKAAAAKAQGLNAIAKKNVHTKSWADLSDKVRASLLEVVAPEIATENKAVNAAEKEGLALKADESIESNVIDAPKSESNAAAQVTGQQAAGAVQEAVGKELESAEKPARDSQDAAKHVAYVGKDIDAEWAQFSKESGTKGIPRAQMPQIKAVHRGAMTNFMNARGVKHEEQEVAADTLKPTQAEFSKEKVARAKAAPATDRSVLVSRDGYVLDGHHQWMAALEKGEQVKVIRLDAEIDQLLTLAHEFPSSTVAEGSPKTSQKQSDKALEAIKSEPVPAPKATASTRIEDVGEKIGGARKDVWTGFNEDLRAVPDGQIQTQPLSKVWPQTDYQKLIDAGHDGATVAMVRSLRDAIPTKPRQSFKVKRWAEQVGLLRSFATDLMDGKLSQQKLREQLRVMGSRDVLGVLGRAELYEAVGHSKSLEGISFTEHHYTLYKGKPNVTMWAVERAAKASAFGNWPRELATGETKEQALEAFKQVYGQLDQPKEKKSATFDIISETYSRNYFVGKKLGRNYAKLAGPFKTVKEARAHRDANEQALIQQLEAYKLVPPERADENRPRVGQDMRGGLDVTPQQFREAFGFRGVEFGNWVEQGKRQQELNQAYDALMDMAAVLQLPPQAISLNGQLGLAFGARGSGGKNAFKAHYEPGKVVINLTKRTGAGSLGHEWWHAVDNYFSRMRSFADGFMTDSSDVRAAASGSKYFPRGEGVRAEMIEAFGAVMRAIGSTGLRARAKLLDERRSSDYWSTDVELSARAFESYLIAKLQDQNASNDYLANVVSPKVWETAAQAGFKLDEAYPYPSIDEMAAIRSGFDHFFDQVQTTETEQGVAMFSRTDQPVVTKPTAIQLRKAMVQRTVDQLSSAWVNRPSITVVDSMADPLVPQKVREADQAQRSQGAHGEPEGFWYGGQVYLVASALPTPAVTARVLYHEVLGHHGLRGHFGKDLDQVLDRVAKLRSKDLQAKAKDYGLNLSKPAHVAYAAEEVLAEMAQTMPEIGFVQRAIAAIRTWLRKHVPGLQSIRLTDAEIIRDYILPARAWVQRGGPDGNGPGGGLRKVTAMSRAEAVYFSRSKVAELKDKGLQMAHTYMSHPGKVSLWDKTVGTMRHLAERKPAFKPVFEAAQQFIDDVSSVANEAAQYAPRLIPRVETMRDMLKKPIAVVDNKAIGKALFGGTLDWGRDQHGKAMPLDDLKAKYAGLTVDQKAEVLLAAGKVQPQLMAAMRGKQLEQFESFINSRFESAILKAGMAFNHKELRDFFDMNEQQISLYDEARATVDKSLDITARAEMLRALGRDWDGFRDMVMDAPTLTDAWKLLDDELEQRAKAIPDSRDQMAAKMFQIRASHDKARELMDGGYMPLQRFGKYTVDVVDADGERIYFGMFESKADSNRMAETMKRDYQDASVTQGTLNDQQYKLFAGITPETAELFGTMLGLDAEGNDAKDQAFQEFLKLSKNNHSALKRLIHRKGIAGYSEDVGRVLASFVYSNARLAATGLNAGKMENAINDLNTKHKQEGELGEIAAKLREYIQDPQEEGQAIRGMLFAQYLGGSIASAMVNMTQPFAVTLPWLSQFGGMAKASRYLSGALKDMATRGFKYDGDLAHALKMAEDDGVVSPQEIHQLMAQARGAGGLRTGDGTKTGDARANAANVWEKVKVGWGQPFALAEQFNRRSTFIAAYRLAKEQGKDNPAEFARRAVVETQFLYTKANKPQWARGAVGGTLFTFKTYSVSFLELMQRTWNAGEAGSPERAAGRRAVGWAMLMLMLMGGAGGLPFVEDVEDLVDSAGQMMGYNSSVKQWRQQAMRDVLGAELADFLESGLSGLPGMPLDVSGRLGMGNLIPGTGLLLDKQSNARDVVELLGPAGDLVQRGLEGTKEIIKGAINADGAQMARGAGQWAPNAVRNLAKGADMAVSGMYKDSKGYKVIDTTLDEAILKAIGFQPRSVAEVQEGNSFMQRSKSFYIQTSSDIKAKWAQALFEKDAAGVERARERVQEWNRKNPDQPIRINMPDIWKRVAQMGKDRTDRIADTAPKALRQQLRSMAQEQSR